MIIPYTIRITVYADFSFGGQYNVFFQTMNCKCLFKNCTVEWNYNHTACSFKMQHINVFLVNMQDQYVPKHDRN